MLSKTLKLFLSFKTLQSHSIYFNHIKGDLIQQKAYLSTQIIKTISQQANIQQLRVRSLPDRIKNIIQNCSVVGQQAKKDLKELFQKGVNRYTEPYATIFDQQRYSQGTIFSNQQILMPGQGLTVVSNPKIIFFPSHLTTGQILNFLMRKNLFIWILKGQLGISKSFSIMMYWFLSKIVHQHILRKQQYKATKLSCQIEIIPKIVYWNINIKSKPSWNFVKNNIILKQMPQLEEIKQKSDWFENSDEVRKFYHKKQPSLRLILVVDQINKLASLARKFKDKKQNSKKRSNKITSMQSKIEAFKDIFAKLKPQFHKIVYLSSNNIQTELLRDLDLSCDGNQTRSIPERVKYSQLLFMDESIYQIVDYFLFQLQMRFKQISTLSESCLFKNDQNNLTAIRQKLRQESFKFIKAKSDSYMLTCNSIFTFFQLKSQYVTKLLNTNSQSQLLSNIIKILNSVVLETQTSLKDDFFYFICKRNINENTRHLLIYQIFHHATAFLELQHSYEANIYSLGKYFFQRFSIQRSKFNFNRDQLQDVIDKNLFQIDDQYIYCLVPPKIILDILEKDISDSVEHILNLGEIDISKDTKSAKGAFFQKNLKQVLKIGFVNFHARFNNKQNIQFKNILKNQIKKTFISLNKLGRSDKASGRQSSGKQDIKKQIQKAKHLNYSLHFSFKDIFNQLQRQVENNQMPFSYFCEPVSLKQYQKKVKYQTKNISSTSREQSLTEMPTDQYSKCIDFALVKFKNDVSDSRIQLSLFDSTISQNAVKLKIKHFLIQYFGIQERYNNKVEINSKMANIKLNYFVIGPKLKQFDLKAYLDSCFSQIIQFKSNNLYDQIVYINSIEQDSNTIITSQNILLQKVGYIQFGDDLQIQIPKKMEQKRPKQFQEIKNRYKLNYFKKLQQYLDKTI